MFEHIDYNQIAKKKPLLKVDVLKFISQTQHFGQNGYGVKKMGRGRWGCFDFFSKKGFV
jgi:hypothetical protein